MNFSISTETILSDGWVFPNEKKKVNIISIVLDAPGDIISALSGKLGRLWGVSSKALYTKTGEKACEEQRREE